MRFSTSRPKDGSEHLLADEIDKILPASLPQLHGEQVTIASLVMGYLYSTNYEERTYIRIRDAAIRLGLPTEPHEIGITREHIIQALQNVRVRKDKYTYFNRFGADIDHDTAEEIYEKVFGSRKKEIEEFRFEVCRYVNNSVKAMFEHIQEKVIPELDTEKAEELIRLLVETRRRKGRVIINAAGRIGEVAVFFQQKLRALGFIVDDFKEITPEFLVNENDLVLTFSGSGRTRSVVRNLENIDEMHRQGKLSGRVFSVTASPAVDTWKIGGGIIP